MNKLLKVAWHEYARNVFKRSFIIVLISLPALIIVSVGIGAFIEHSQNSGNAVGYVDQSGFLANPVQPPQPATSPDNPSPRALVPLIAYDDEAQAKAALEAKKIQAYYVIPSGYPDDPQVRLVYVKQPGSDAVLGFRDFMRINALRGVPAADADRVVSGSNLTVLWPADTPGGGRTFSQQTFLSNFLPLIGAIMLVVMIFVSASYLMQAVVEEKENRTIEIVVTSLSPGQLISGKILGIIGIAITQLAAWGIFALLTVLIGGNALGLGLLRNLSLDWKFVAITVVLGLPTFVLVAALLTAAGSALSEVQEAQQVSGLITLPVAVPLWFAGLLLEHPDSPITLVLSFIPITSISTYGLRLTGGPVPTWQIAVSVGITSVCAAVALIVAARAFRLGMLRYGQHLKLRDLFGSRRKAQVEGVQHG